MNGIGVVCSRWIGIGNGDCLIVFDGVGEGELNGGAGDGDSGNGVSCATGCDGECGGGCSCGGERLVVGEDNFGAVAVGGSGGEGIGGAVPATVELLVTEVLVREAASLPALS